MQCTPESNVFLESCEGQHCYGDCSDSGYSGLFHSPQSFSGIDSCRSVSPVELSETPKENLRLSVTPKERIREPVTLIDRDRRIQRPAAVSWCETPKRDSSLRYRLQMCRPSTAVKADNTRSPCTRKTESTICFRSENWLTESFDSLDPVMGALASNTSKLEQDLLLSGRKRRLLFTQVRTSTLEDGKLHSDRLSSFERGVSLSEADFSGSNYTSDEIKIETSRFRKNMATSFKENIQSPVSSGKNNLCDSSGVLCTPASIHTPRYIRYVLF